MAAANPPFNARAIAAPGRPAGLAYKWLVLIVLLPGMTLFTVDMTVVNVGLAKLGAVYGVSVDTVQWAITGYALAAGIATPLAGFVETRFTMKRVFVIGLAVFTAASVVCGVAPAFWVLVAGRVVQGLAAGLMLPMVISLIFKVFPPDERGAALGFFAIPIVAGPALGPTSAATSSPTGTGALSSSSTCPLASWRRCSGCCSCVQACRSWASTSTCGALSCRRWLLD